MSEFFSGAAGSLLHLAGSVIGNQASRKAQQAAQAEARRQFDEQMKKSVQYRVADAKAAGIHPLFALGASVGASPTSAVGTAPPTGSAAGDALQGLGAALIQAQTRQANAAAGKDEVEAQLVDSTVKRLNQQALVGPPQEIEPAEKNPKNYGGGLVYRPEVPLAKENTQGSVRLGNVPEQITINTSQGPVDVPNPEMFDDIMNPAFIKAQVVKWWRYAGKLAVGLENDLQRRKFEGELANAKTKAELKRFVKKFIRHARSYNPGYRRSPL